ncbi:MAG TPA: flagellar hook-basal body complex protein FliE [Bacillota bacterium]|nr:flagellar hook-basal body complex protein FliE [Bacillota bacterium]HOL09114.1 flagellar hook-basal body complex protein FliE [Bacillota bacterium]HPO97171.1 flagellar hook-basal body complex protein FliE [Bacillota bacterium]
MDVRSVIPVSLTRPESFLNNKTEPKVTTESFEKVLGRVLNDVNELQLQSAELNDKLASGQLEYLHQATVISEKATLALQLTIQVRNKVVEAYQEIMRTQF